MDIIREFEKKAAECRAMARATRDQQSRASWMEMAGRWSKLAESHPLARKAGPPPHAAHADQSKPCRAA
jgi:hypothetical protein